MVDSGPCVDSQRAGDYRLTGSDKAEPGKLTGQEQLQVMRAFRDLVETAPALRETKIRRLNLPKPIEQRLRTMLAANDKTGMLDDALIANLEPPPTAYASLEPGDIVGGFRVGQLIGRGGMGEVYLAYRDNADFEQRAALKMLRPEAADRFARFGAERRMLASLDHPSIARLIDGGLAPDGRPYMIMDYVEGEEINVWCAAHQADLTTRIRLFLELCDAVSHAHARLVIHRDIKPANILVDKAGHAHLLDFGIARLLDTNDTSRPMTDALLTPQYAAPEQLDGGDITVATDVYALGAVLFELLAGRGPWLSRGDSALPTALRRLLHDEPPKPSSVSEVASVRPAQIEGDLDAIVMKAMRRETKDRYPSVEALSADIRRYLAFEPVEARDGAVGYRIRRFMRRNRGGVIAAALIMVSLLAGGVGISWQAHRAAGERDAALTQAERSEAVNQALMLMFREASDQGRTDSITARELIDSTARRLIASLDSGDPKSGDIVGALSDLYILTEDLKGSQSLLEEAFAKGVARNDPAGQSRLKLKLAQAYGATHRFDEARKLLAEAGQVWATDPERYRVERVEAASAEAYMLRLEGKQDEGIALLLRTMPEAERAYASNSRDLATRYANLATHLVMANRLGEAEALLQRADILLSRSGTLQSPAGLTLMQLRGSIAARRGHIERAEAIFRKAVATRRELYGKSYSLAVNLLQHGKLLTELGRPAEALPIIDEAQAMAREYFGTKGSLTLLTGLARAEALIAMDRIREAESALAPIDSEIQNLGLESADYASLLLTQAMLALKRGDLKGAKVKIDRADAISRKLGSGGSALQRPIKSLRTQYATQSGTS